MGVGEPNGAPSRPTGVNGSTRVSGGRALRQRQEKKETDGSDVEQVYAREHQALGRLAAVMTGDVDAAAEIVQESFVDLVRAADDVEDPAVWLRTVVVNRSRSWIRRRVVARRYLERQPPPEHDPPVDPADAEAQVDVRRALSELDPEQRAVLFLRYYLDMSEAQVAAALGCRPGTVKSRASRALRRMKEVLDG